MKSTRKRTRRGLAVLFLVVFGITGYLVSNWSHSTVDAAVARAARVALDDAAARFQAEPTVENAALLNDARIAFSRAVAADPSYLKANPHPTLGLSAKVQIDAFHKMKSELTPTQRKIGSRLLLSAMKRQNRLPLGLESLRTNVKTSKAGNAVVEITVTSRIPGLKALDRFSLTIRNAVGKHIRAEVPLDKLEAIAAVPEVISIREPVKFFTSRAESPSGSALAVNGGFNARAAQVRAQLNAAIAARAGAVSPRPMFAINVSEGDKTHRAEEARHTFGVNGTGVKVGVLSDGVDSLTALEASGDLPPSVTVLPGQAGEGDEGSAMLEIVHDLAPGAQLFFATANPDQAQFAQNIRDLRTAGCDIIIDDVIYLDESPVHDGQPGGLNSTLAIIEQAVNDVTASGAMYFSSAGNEGNKDDLTSGTWEGDFNPSAAADPAPLAGANLHNFGDGGNSILVEFGGGNPPLLHWASPLDTAADDYDLYDMDGALTTIFDASTDVQDGSGGDDQPIEFIDGGTFGGERLLIDKFAGLTRFLSLRVFRGELDDNLATDGSTHGHSHAANAFSVAATPAAASFDGVTPDGPFPNPFSSSNQIESFSNDGPRRIFFNPNNTFIGDGTLAGTHTTRQKPDVTAADGVSCAAPGFEQFYGTSAAAPHAGAIAALLKSANGSLTRDQIYNALKSSAIDIHASGVDRDSGSGIVMAFQALQAIGATPQAFLATGTVTFTETGGDGDGVLEPCERAAFTIPLINEGGATATGISATLTSSTPGVVINPNTSAYPNLAPTASANNTTPFVVTLPCSLVCGSTVNFTLTVTYSGGVSPQTFNFSYQLGAAGTPVTFSYTGPPVPIPDSAGADVGGTPATVPLTVSGITGGVFDVKFSFDGTSCSSTVGSTTVGLEHTFVNDLQVTLTSPASTSVLMINRTDSGGNNFCQTVLSDAATTPIQSVISTDAPFTGTFKPNSPLSAFKGQLANGTWTLSVQDFFVGDTGNIRAFSVVITPANCQTSPCVLTCPANVTVNSSTPTVVTYPQPTISGGCGIVSCSPPSGSTFPVGTSTVTCSSETATSCSFTVTVKQPFDVCVQDDSIPGKVFLGNSKTGAYTFCCGTTSFSGTATVKRVGNTITFTDNLGTHRMSATYDGGAFKGNASLQTPLTAPACTITDRDTRNNTCNCGGGQQT